MKRAIQFWNKRSTTFDENARKAESTYQEIMMRTSKHLKTSDVVLDLGCATGRTAMDLSDKVEEVVAIDISDKMIAIAKEKNAIRKKQNIHFERATIYDVQADQEQFNIIMALNVMHLLDDPSDAMNCIYDLLKPGGLFISSTPYKTENISLNNLFLSTLDITGFVPNLKFSQASELEEYVLSAGLEITTTHSIKNTTPSYFMIAQKGM